jgi:hypothetical protein
VDSAVECDRKRGFTEMRLGAWVLNKQGFALILSSYVLECEDRYMMWISHSDIDDRFLEIHIAPLHKDKHGVMEHCYRQDEVIDKFYARFLIVEKFIIDDDDPVRFILYKDKALPKDAVIIKFSPLGSCDEQITVATNQFQIDINEPFMDNAYCIDVKRLPSYCTRSVAYLTFAWQINKPIPLLDFQILPHMKKTYLEYRKDRENENCRI